MSPPLYSLTILFLGGQGIVLIIGPEVLAVLRALKEAEQLESLAEVAASLSLVGNPSAMPSLAGSRASELPPASFSLAGSAVPSISLAGSAVPSISLAGSPAPSISLAGSPVPSISLAGYPASSPSLGHSNSPLAEAEDEPLQDYVVKEQSASTLEDAVPTVLADSQNFTDNAAASETIIISTTTASDPVVFPVYPEATAEAEDVQNWNETLENDTPKVGLFEIWYFLNNLYTSTVFTFLTNVLRNICFAFVWFSNIGYLLYTFAFKIRNINLTLPQLSSKW
jgi:hypothetical protein